MTDALTTYKAEERLNDCHNVAWSLTEKRVHGENRTRLHLTRLQVMAGQTEYNVFFLYVPASLGLYTKEEAAGNPSLACSERRRKA